MSSELILVFLVNKEEIWTRDLFQHWEKKSKSCEEKKKEKEKKVIFLI